MSERDISAEVASSIIGVAQVWLNRMEIEGSPKVYVRDEQHTGTATMLVEGYGEYRIFVQAEKLPPPGPEDDGAIRDEMVDQESWEAYCEANGLDPDCQECNYGGHTCPGDGNPIKHGQGDCGEHDEPSRLTLVRPGCPAGLAHIEGQDCTVVGCYWTGDDATYAHVTDVRADRLAEGDEIYSKATGKWHAIVEASSHAGSTTLVIQQDEHRTFRFQPDPATTYTTRRGPAGRAVDLLGGEVIRSA